MITSISQYNYYTIDNGNIEDVHVYNKKLHKYTLKTTLVIVTEPTKLQSEHIHYIKWLHEMHNDTLRIV